MIHELKCSPEYFEDVASGMKPFEIRKNDRPFKVNDFVALNEYDKTQEPKSEDPAAHPYTGRCTLLEITYILDNEEYCKKGLVTLGLAPCAIRSSNRMHNQTREFELGGCAPIYGR